MSYIVPEIQQWLPSGTPPTPTGNLMYWTDWGTEKIQRANLDGTNVQDLVTRSNGLRNPNGIALDLTDQKMYWTDQFTDKNPTRESGWHRYRRPRHKKQWIERSSLHYCGCCGWVKCIGLTMARLKSSGRTSMAQTSKTSSQEAMDCSIRTYCLGSGR